MIPNTQHAQVISSGQMETNQASIAMTPEMFDMLSSKVYTNKVLAVVREIICNAKDAHVDSGVSKAIDVHLPNTLEPWFSVRDYGKGLTHQQVMNLYLSYGESTKTTSNDVIGGLGIGSKSPLAYSTSFTVEAIQNGSKRTYNIYKDQGIPCVSKLAEVPTEESDGILVKVTVKDGDYRSFKKNAEEFLQFFDYDVNVVGQQIDTEVNQLLDSEHYTTYEPWTWNFKGVVQAIMGGVVYNISQNLTEELRKFVQRDHMLIKFNIGELSVAASRESLSEDKVTIKAIEDKIGKVLEVFKQDLQTQINNGTPMQAYAIATKYHMFSTNRCPNTGNMERVLTNGYKDFKYNSKPLLGIAKDLEKKVHLFSTGHYAKKGGSAASLHAMTDNVIYLVKDTGTRYIAVAKAHKNAKNQPVALIEKEDVELIKKLMGVAKIEKVSNLIETYFPKGQKVAGKVTIPKSGVFDHMGKEVTELDESDEGYYIPFENQDCVMKGKKGWSKFTDIQLVINLFLNLEENGDKIVKDKFYLVRKGGLKAIAKTQIKEIEYPELLKMVKKVVVDNCKDIEKKIVMADCLRFNGFKDRDRNLAKLHEDIYTTYPLMNAKREFRNCYNDQYYYLVDRFGMVFNDLMFNVDKLAETMQKALDKEQEEYDNKYSFLGAINSYALRESDLESLKKFIKFTQKQ